MATAATCYIWLLKQAAVWNVREGKRMFRSSSQISPSLDLFIFPLTQTVFFLWLYHAREEAGASQQFIRNSACGILWLQK